MAVSIAPRRRGGEGAIPLPFRRQNPTERDSALRGLPAPRAEPMEPHPTPHTEAFPSVTTLGW
jgi:hypothetical protein